jgi:type I restriction enzyme S subunit
MTAQQLKNSIFQLAVQGKLVPQDPNDEPASVLLERICAEKQRLMREGKIKKEKLLPPIAEDEIPFDVPEGWKLCRVIDLFNFIDYRGATPTKTTSGIPFVTAKNIKNGYTDYSVDEYISMDSYENRKSRGISRKGDILFTTEAPLGNVALADLDEYSAGQRLITLQNYSDEAPLNNTLFMFFLLSGLFKQQLKEKQTGTTVKGIKAEKLKKLILPLPPLAEQRRIVERIEQLLPHIAEYDATEQKLTALNKQFPDQLKKSILQAAVQGKLVEQDPNDEPASVLLERIRAEKEQLVNEGKIKKEKPLPPIAEDDIPFDVPEGWEWVRISDVTTYQEGPGILAVDFRSKGIPLIRIAGMQGEVVSLTACNYLDPEMVAKKWSHFRLDDGDVVISTSASIDKIAIVDSVTEGAIPYTGLIRFKMSEALCREYFIDYIKSPTYLQQIMGQIAGGTIKHYGPSHLRKMIIPVPPLVEQRRIVAKCEELLVMAEQCKERCNT